jgi:hypothetical protein
MADPFSSARIKMHEADRRLDRGRAHLAAGRLPAAHEQFSGAAQAYVSGAVDYQQQPAVASAIPIDMDLDAAVTDLTGRLRVEAETALEAFRQGAGERSETVDVAASQRLAEDLRERLAYAVPELFDRSSAPDLTSRSPSSPGR